MERESWDLFCRVVDNYGDVGIAWRLARQLATSGERDVRLVVDGIDSLARIAHAVDATRARQTVDGIELVRRSDLVDPAAAADVVVELLGCGLPAAYLDALAARRVPAVWIDFEHLSAESWVEEFHGLPSPHPTRALVKHFFYPGFGARTGGLPIEPDFDARRAAFDGHARDAFLARIGVRSMRGAGHISLFAYRDAPVAGLLGALAHDASRHWSLLVPDGPLAAEVARWFGTAARTRGALTVTTVPFVDQDDYDRLLWCCDVNFVRGEDSFVRAQAAGRPFVWHIYPQADAAHLAKLRAFEDLLEADVDPVARAAQRAFWTDWNDPAADVGPSASRWLAALPTVAAAAAAWGAQVRASPPLVERLVRFVAARRTVP